MIAAALTAPTDVAYAFGYGVPWVWAGLLAVWTLLYIRRQLVDEKSEWDRGVRVEMALPVCASPIDRESDTSSTRACITKGSDVKMSEGVAVGEGEMSARCNRGVIACSTIRCDSDYPQ